MAGSIPYTRIDVQNRAVDAASYVATTWLAGGDLNQTFSRIEIDVSIATAAVLYKVLSLNSDGSSPFATTAINEGVPLTPDTEYGWTSKLRGSTYMNFQFGATTTMKEFFGVELHRW